MIKFYKKNKRDKNFKEYTHFVKNSLVYVEDPSLSELEQLSIDFELEHNICLDALDVFEVPRIEKEDGRIYLFIRFAQNSLQKVSTHPLLLIIDKDYLMIISVRPLPFLEAIVKGNSVGSSLDKIEIISLIFEAVYGEFERQVTSIHKNIRSMSSDLAVIDNKEINEFVKFETIFNDFLFGLEPTVVVLQKLASGKFCKISTQDKDLIEDLIVDNEQLIRICKNNQKGIVNIRESHSSILSNNLNKTMKLLTSLTLILTIPTMVASFFGMNVSLPLQSHPYAFLGVLGLTVVLSFGLLALFNKRDLL